MPRCPGKTRGPTQRQRALPVPRDHASRPRGARPHELPRGESTLLAEAWLLAPGCSRARGRKARVRALKVGRACPRRQRRSATVVSRRRMSDEDTCVIRVDYMGDCDTGQAIHRGLPSSVTRGDLRGTQRVMCPPVVLVSQLRDSSSSASQRSESLCSRRCCSAPPDPRGLKTQRRLRLSTPVQIPSCRNEGNTGTARLSLVGATCGN